MITTPKRYQLRKDAIIALRSGHPWIFRDNISSAASIFEDGQWLRLYDGSNQVLGYGMYESRGAIAIRVLRIGDAAPNAVWLQATVQTAMQRRSSLRESTNAIRWISGESDGLPAVVVESFADIVVAQSYSRGSDAITRLAAIIIKRALSAREVTWKPAKRRVAAIAQGPAAPLGTAANLASPTAFREGPLIFAADIRAGQKTGAYLDLRGLRQWLAQQPLAGQRVLNLFSYTGMLARAAEHAGAAAITSVDASAAALAFARQHHVTDPGKHTFLTADIFEWIAHHRETYQMVIVDPPAMTSRKEQVAAALASYRRLYKNAASLTAANGTLIAACCTGRISRAVFNQTVATALGPEFVLQSQLPSQPDHPAAFKEADYLKILIFRRG
jgi:23S rRNA (cytosine1962-C5)-methyltransferase